MVLSGTLLKLRLNILKIIYADGPFENRITRHSINHISRSLSVTVKCLEVSWGLLKGLNIILFRPFDLLARKTFKIIWLSNLSTSRRTWWTLFQKRVVCTEFDTFLFQLFVCVVCRLMSESVTGPMYNKSMIPLCIYLLLYTGIQYVLVAGTI